MRRMLALLAAIALSTAIGACSLPGRGCDVTIAAVDAPDLDAIPADSEVLVRPADIDPAGWQVEEVPGGEPTVTMRLRPEAAERVAEHTRDHVGSFLAVEVDGRVVVTPMIMTAIEDGVIQFTTGVDTDIRDAFLGCLPVEIPPA